MKRKLTLSVLLPLVASAVLVLRASAVESYAVDWWTVDGGGATFSDGGTYSLGGTIGQPDAGPVMSGGLYSLTGGFWAGAVAAVTPPEFVTISGDAGIGEATLTYFDAGLQTATADSEGVYTITVPSNWSGEVTPSMPGYSFDPSSRSYAIVQLDQTAQNYTVTPIALEVDAVYPAEGSQNCRRPQLGADLGFAGQAPTIETGDALTDGLSVGTSTIVLTLDGTDVTTDAEVTMLRSYPALYSVLYMPITDLALGAHEAVLEYPSMSGQQTRTWNFTVADIACSTFYTEPDVTVDSIP